MKILTLLLISLLLNAQVSICKNIYYNNNLPDLLYKDNSKEITQEITQEICYSNFAINYSLSRITPIFSAEHLIPLNLKSIPRTNSFHTEPSTDSEHEASLQDYSGSGYDRGHLAPAADMPSVTSQYESFTLANMVPQNPNNNRGIWSAIESTTRKLTRVSGELYVISGGIYDNSIKMGKVPVPDRLFKIIFNPKIKQGAVYIVNNSKTSVKGNGFKIISIYDIENITKINFFKDLTISQKKIILNLPIPKK